jgi:hypothetical protein
MTTTLTASTSSLEQRRHNYYRENREYIASLRYNPKCFENNCMNEKLWKNHAYARCFFHGGVFQIFIGLAKYMRNTTQNSRKEFFLKANLDDIPLIDDLILLYRLQEGCCAECGVRLQIVRGDRTSNAISIDRVHSRIPYILSNIRITCLFCNQGKNQSTAQNVHYAMDVMFRQIPNVVLPLKEKYPDDYLRILYYCHLELPPQNIRNHHICKNISQYAVIKLRQGKKVDESKKKIGMQSCTAAWVYHRISTQQYRCSIIGSPLCLCEKISYCPFKPSVDRIDNSIRDYSVRYNNHIVSIFINLARGEKTLEELYEALNQRIISYRRWYAKKQELVPEKDRIVSMDFVPLTQAASLSAWLQQPYWTNNNNHSSSSCQCLECTNPKVREEAYKKIQYAKRNYRNGNDKYLLRNPLPSLEEFHYKASVKHDIFSEETDFEYQNRKKMSTLMIPKWWPNMTTDGVSDDYYSFDEVIKAISFAPAHIVASSGRTNIKKRKREKIAEEGEDDSHFIIEDDEDYEHDEDEDEE